MIRCAVRRVVAGAATAFVVLGALPAQAADAPLLKPCRLPGVEYEARCGVLRRPLDPAQPNGTAIDLHFAVLPALARHKLPDPVFFLAGGPGQSAMELAGMLGGQFGQFLNRRDLVMIDQRGTGRSAPLECQKPKPLQPLSQAVQTDRQLARLIACRDTLMRLPYGNLMMFTTSIAMADMEAVRIALGAGQVNVIGVSYGTRAALEYMRQFPQAVRRVVIDGVAPPDMVLPQSAGQDGQAAFDALLGWCEADKACRMSFPGLRGQWRSLLESLPRQVSVAHPGTGVVERIELDREAVLGLVRAPLYAPARAAALPFAVSQAGAGRFEALLGLGYTLPGAPGGIADGMYLSVICAEDYPRRVASPASAPAGDAGDTQLSMHDQVCPVWPRGEVPPAFYTVPATRSPTLVLSGGIDPVTPPRHGARVATALGPKARHVVVPNAGHGVMTSLPCMADVVYKFINAATDDEALAVQTGCGLAIPRPPAFVPPRSPP